jgi:NADH-quinone oxidoreductase subunit F
MYRILDRMCKGEGKPEDIPLLKEMSEIVIDSSLCGLGQTAPKPLLTAIKYFRDEYLAHVEGICPAKACRDLITYYIDPNKCRACGLCIKSCSAGAIYGQKKFVHVINQEKCIKCGTCFEICPEKFDAIIKISGETVPPTSEGIPIKTKK